MENQVTQNLPEIKLCYGCKKLKLLKDIHGQAYLISNTTTESRSKRESILSLEHYKRINTTSSLLFYKEEITICNKCWEGLEEGFGIKDPNIPEKDEIHIDSYKSAFD